MNQELIQKLRYSNAQQQEFYELPLPMRDSLQLITEFFNNNSNNKLCLVFPVKELVSQWLIAPLIFEAINTDFNLYSDEIGKSYEGYKKGDKLFLNGSAVVEWLKSSVNGVTFLTKGTRTSDGAEITIRKEQVVKLRKAPKTRVLSSHKRVTEVLPHRIFTPTEKLLGIDTYGNRTFLKKRLCLVGKFKSYENSIKNIVINNEEINDYFNLSRIDENGNISEENSFLIANNFSSLILHLAEFPIISKIIIDGFNSVTPRNDFSDVDREFKIPTVLITDLSEIESFEEIKNCGFEFYNFTKDKLTIQVNNGSPFENFEKKLSKYVSFRFQKEVFISEILETVAKKLHSLNTDDTDENLNFLKISLIQLTNLLSRICYVPNESEISVLNQKITKIEAQFLNNQLWLGEARQIIEDSILLLKKFVQEISNNKTEKCKKLETLLKQQYDYIICPTEEEATTLRNHIKTPTIKIISVADVNDNILSRKKVKAILTGWAKSNIVNRVLSSFLFSEIFVLFYQFENGYYNSLQSRNRKSNENIKPTVTKRGVGLNVEDSTQNGFEDLYTKEDPIESTSGIEFDIVEFELKIENTQYAKYSGKGNIAESCKAKRIDFENNDFLYATETHKFLVLNELIESAKSNPNIYSKKFEELKTGDVIAFIDTDRDVLVELIEKTTKTEELAKIKQWTELWKSLLRDYFSSIGNDSKKLVEDLRKFDCKKHPYTIKNWIQDDSLIGPDSDDDLRSIGMLAQSDLLFENINTVREAINQMTGLRFQAATLVRDKIRTKLLDIAEPAIINTSIEIPDLGRVEILKISELKKEAEEIDKKFVHRLIAKEII